MVFNATFNTILAISWRSVLLIEETGISEENYWPSRKSLTNFINECCIVWSPLFPVDLPFSTKLNFTKLIFFPFGKRGIQTSSAWVTEVCPLTHISLTAHFPGSIHAVLKKSDGVKLVLLAQGPVRSMVYIIQIHQHLFKDTQPVVSFINRTEERRQKTI